MVFVPDFYDGIVWFGFEISYDKWDVSINWGDGLANEI